MTAAPHIPPPTRVDLLNPSPLNGCTAVGCNTQATVLLHPRHGRRCPEHITLPPGSYRPDLADDCIDTGHAGAAFAYLAAYLTRTCDEKFAQAATRYEGTA